MYRWHITYTDRSGATQVGRVGGKNRTLAIQSAAWKFGVPQKSITSAVRISR